MGKQLYGPNPRFIPTQEPADTKVHSFFGTNPWGASDFLEGRFAIPNASTRSRVLVQGLGQRDFFFDGRSHIQVLTTLDVSYRYKIFICIFISVFPPVMKEIISKSVVEFGLSFKA